MCNQRATAWICEACGFGSRYYNARFNDDARSTTPTMMARRNLYPKPTPCEYADVAELPALTTNERMVRVRKRMEIASEVLSQQHAMTLLQGMKDEARPYADIAAFVDCNRARREQSYDLPRAATNYIPPIDPRRWCDECIAYRRHRRGCALIEADGLYIGGYPDDGLRVAFRFKRLQAPTKHWTPSQHRQHARAIRKRWDAFIASWTSIGLDVFARAVSSASPVALAPR